MGIFLKCRRASYRDVLLEIQADSLSDRKNMGNDLRNDKYGDNSTTKITLLQSDPHPGNFFWPSFWHILFGCRYDIYVLTFFLAFYLASILTLYLASILTFFLSYVLTFYLAVFLTFSLACVQAQACSTASGAGRGDEDNKEAEELHLCQNHRSHTGCHDLYIYICIMYVYKYIYNIIIYIYISILSSIYIYIIQKPYNILGDFNYYWGMWTSHSSKRHPLRFVELQPDATGGCK